MSMSMSLPQEAGYLDWPLSRDEKKFRIMKLYERELQEIDLSQRCQQECSGRPLSARLSNASTADTELDSTAAQAFCDDQLQPINEDLETSIHSTPLKDDVNATMNSTDDRHVQTVAQQALSNLRDALADTIATIRGLEGHPPDSTPQGKAGPAGQCSPPWRRAVSEDLPRGSVRQRVSLGRREGRLRTSRGSRSRDQSRSLLDESIGLDSDGAEGDTEEPRRKVETASSGRRKRNSCQGIEHTRPAESCGDLPSDDDSTSNKQVSRSRSLPPPVHLASLQDFLGEVVPQFPF